MLNRLFLFICLLLPSVSFTTVARSLIDPIDQFIYKFKIKEPSFVISECSSDGIATVAINRIYTLYSFRYFDGSKAVYSYYLNDNQSVYEFVKHIYESKDSCTTTLNKYDIFNISYYDGNNNGQEKIFSKKVLSSDNLYTKIGVRYLFQFNNYQDKPCQNANYLNFNKFIDDIGISNPKIALYNNDSIPCFIIGELDDKPKQYVLKRNCRGITIYEFQFSMGDKYFSKLISGIKGNNQISHNTDGWGFIYRNRNNERFSYFKQEPIVDQIQNISVNDNLLLSLIYKYILSISENNNE